LKERQLLIKHINYGQKNEIGEKSREIGTAQSLQMNDSRERETLSLSSFALFLRANVFI
jgi:hypothetical protein